MNTTASLAVKKARYERLVEVVESKGQPAWGRSWHWGSQLRIWGGSECTGGRARKQGGIVHIPPPSCARQGKNRISLYLDSKPDRFGTRLALQTPELRDQNCCELGGGHQPHPCAPPGPFPFFPALGGMVRTLQPPAAARHWIQPLGAGYFLGSPLHAKPTVRLSTRVVISQDLWRKPKSRAVLVINQKFFAQFPNRFPGDLLIGTPHSTAPSPQMATPSLQTQGLGWGGTSGFGIIRSPPMDK